MKWDVKISAGWDREDVYSKMGKMNGRFLQEDELSKWPSFLWMKNRISAILITLIVIFGLLPSIGFSASVEDKLSAELTTSFNKAKSLSGLSSFSGYCGKCTGYQLWAVGIFGAYHGSNGNKTYDLYKKLKPKSGDSVTAFPGAEKGGNYTITSILNLLNESNPNGEQTYTVFSFKTGSSSTNGQTYGHVLLVHSVYKGKVYWCESFGASTRVDTIANFANTYKTSGNKYRFDGAVAFGYKERTQILPQNIELNYSYASLDVSKTLSLSAKAYPENASSNVTWVSSDDKIATVSDSGVVTGHQAGKRVSITAISTLDSSVKATCEVTTYYQGTGTLKFNGIKYPHVYAIGKSFTWQGKVESDVDLETIVITLYTTSSKYTQSVSITSGTKSYSMSNVGDSLFKNLTAGRYWFQIVATDIVGRKIGFSNDSSASSTASSHTLWGCNNEYMRSELVAETERNGHRYLLYKDTSKSWANAKSYAEEIGGHLVTIADADENEFVCAFCENAGYDFVFTGGYYTNTGWKWVDGSSFDYHPWRSDVENDGAYQYNPVSSLTRASQRTWGKATDTEMSAFLVEFDPQPVTAIIIENENDIGDMLLEDVKTISVQILPENAYNRNIELRTSDNSVVAVNSEKKEIMAVGEGKAEISVVALDGNGASATIAVNVSRKTVHVTSISTYTDDIQEGNDKWILTIGASCTIQYKYEPQNADDFGVTCYSDNDEIASFDDYNVLTANSTGVCMIYVVSNDDTEVKQSISLTVIPATGTCGDNATWSYSDGTLIISGTGRINNFANVDDRPWNRLAPYITEVIIEPGISYIGECCFESFTSMNKISIPDTVTYMAYRAFYDCDSLQTISLPNSLSGIASVCFMECDNLQSIYMPDTVTSIGYYTFKSCASLTEVHLSNHLGMITYGSFADCISLNNIEVPESVEKIGYRAFEGCQKLKKITILSSSTEFDCSTHPDAETAYKSLNSALNNCPNVIINCFKESSAYVYAVSNNISFKWIDSPIEYPDFVLPAGIRTIEEEAFVGIAAKRIKLSESVEKIEANAFANCPNLFQIYIPESCENIATSAFDGLTKLTIYGADGSYAEWYASRRGFDFVAVE